MSHPHSDASNNVPTSKLRPARWRFVVYALLATLLLMGRDSAVVTPLVPISDCRGPTVLQSSESLTFPLLFRLLPAGWDHWSHITFTLVAASLLGLVGVWLDGRLTRPLALLLVGGMALTVETDQLIGLVVVGLVAWRSRLAIGWVESAAWLLLAVASTREAGVVLLLLAAAPRTSDIRPLVVAFVTLIVSLTIGEWLSPGLLSVLARPLSCWAVLPPSGLLPSLAFPWNRGDVVGPILLLAFILWHVVESILRTPGFGTRRAILTLAAAAWGMSFAHYFPHAALIIALSSEQTSNGIRQSRWWLLVDLTCLLAAAAYGGPSVLDTANSWRTGLSKPLVDPTRWGITGPVLLFDLDQAKHWQSGRHRELFPLILDDRWERFAPSYADYAGVCRDLHRLRPDRYLLADGSEGGYRRYWQEWLPTLVVVAIEQLDEIRRLSLNPDVALVALDGQRAIFARSEDRKNATLIRRAGQSFLQLEWPTSQPTLASAIAAVGSQRARVAAALAAIRLPYAALRVGDDPMSQCLAYLELAHRSYRNADTPSLLDQARAMALSQRLLEEGWIKADQAARLQRSRDELASRVPGKSDSPETRVRAALLRGDIASVTAELAKLPTPERVLFSALTEAPRVEPRYLEPMLAKAIEGGLSAELRSEALYYLGCLRLEVGDTSGAIGALQESLLADSASPFRYLIQLHLAQLSRR